MTDSYIGADVRRVEDLRLLTGAANFIDDISPAGALHASVVRSPHAHARIVGIDAARALEADGVIAVYTFEDLGDLQRPLPLLIPNEALTHPRTALALARDHVNFVGEPVAFVVASARYLAEDAAALVEVHYEPVPAVVGIDAAIAADHLVHDDVPNNVAALLVQEKSDVDAAFAAAGHTLQREIRVERSAATPLECRGVVAIPDSFGHLLVYDTTQAPSTIRAGLASYLGLAEHEVDVVAPDVGGGFGVKLPVFYAEELLVPWAALRLGRPVKWIEDRTEHFLASNHERGQLHRTRVAFDDDGTILAVDDEFFHDSGAYCPYGIIVPVVSAARLPGAYRIAAYRSTMRTVYTNTAPVSPYRGAGMPQAIFVIERCVDFVARQLGLDRAEVRQRNFIPPSAFPYQVGLRDDDGTMTTYDSGPYAELLALVVKRSEASLSEAIAEAERSGRALGLGFSMFVEGTGQGPYEGARVHVETTGRVLVTTGVASQGQSHETTLGQIAADVLGVPFESVVVREGDTAAFKWSTGTFAARIAVVGGNAVARAATKVREKALKIAAEAFEASPGDLEIRNGVVSVKGSPEISMPLAQVAILSNPLRYAFSEDALAATEFAGDSDGRAGPSSPASAQHGVAEEVVPAADDVDPGLEATAFFAPERGTFASGAHAVLVAVDRSTGEVEILRYFLAHDVGVMINPSIVEGQVHGGLAQGIAGTLYERMNYATDGQLTNATFMDFLMPCATELPRFEVEQFDVPSQLNPLGIKGIGEAGVIGPAPAIIGAIEDAIGVEIAECPITPAQIMALLGKADATQ